MKLTVDASVAVKWFVAEPLHGEARRLLSHRLCLHAPDILLAEFANTIWKKARKGELDDPQPYFDELALLPNIVTLHPTVASSSVAPQGSPPKSTIPSTTVSTWPAPRSRRRC